MSKLSEYKWFIEITEKVSIIDKCYTCGREIFSPLTLCWMNCTKEYMNQR